MHSDFLNRIIEFVVVGIPKFLPDLCDTETDDRLSITVTSHGFEQVLAAPKLPLSKGEGVISVVYKTLQGWFLKNITQAFVFNTSGNSGRLNGACILFE